MELEHEDKIRMGVAVNLAWQEALSMEHDEIKDFDLIVQRAFEIKDKYVSAVWNEYAHRKKIDQEKEQEKEIEELKKEMGELKL